MGVGEKVYHFKTFSRKQCGCRGLQLQRLCIHLIQDGDLKVNLEAELN